MATTRRGCPVFALGSKFQGIHFQDSLGLPQDSSLFLSPVDSITTTKTQNGHTKKATMATHPVGAIVVIRDLYLSVLNDSSTESSFDDHPLYIDAVVRLRKMQIRSGKSILLLADFSKPYSPVLSASRSRPREDCCRRLHRQRWR